MKQFFCGNVIYFIVKYQGVFVFAGNKLAWKEQLLELKQVNWRC